MLIDPLRRWWRWTLVALLLPVTAAWIVGSIAERRALNALEMQAGTDARLRQALFQSEVARFRLLPLALAGDRDLPAALVAAGQARLALNRKLEGLAATTGAAAIYVLDRQGRAIAASNWRTPRSFVGQDYAFRPYYRLAERDGAASQFGLGTISGKPGLYLSRRVDHDGVIVVKLEFDLIERQWRQAEGITFVTDDMGVILVTSRPDWRFRTTRALSPTVTKRLQAELKSGPGSLRPLPFGLANERRRVRLSPSSEQMVHAALSPADGWRLHLLAPAARQVRGAVRSAQFAAAFAVLALIGVAWGIAERWRRRAVQVAAATARTVELEAAVAARTGELRREMDERVASEARAETLREGLRQANRLATLGQVTASVAHETAQPVAAIRTYAVNSERLLDRGDENQVRANLQAIGRLADRIGTVTAELRGFARKGTGDIQPIALAEAMDGALLILKGRMAGINLSIPPIPSDLRVMAGKVRLEQVLVNLLQNAAEALAGQRYATITVSIRQAGTYLLVDIADNGPGIASTVADRIFTPFVTSRASGLGLGLVIALDIMTDMDGNLELVPSDHGACFRLKLRRPT
ncbi:sensor histidine kinase [Sphingomonas cynarae]|uniref:histidine kinase n=1 Tax=Sphingomonas cynarae TaxID=930197 RepID=A0ABP7E8V0_9SPHN